MSKHPLDQLFKNKLEDYNTPPSDQAWEKLQSQMGAGRKLYLLKAVKIAASFLLLCVAAYFFWNLGYQSAIRTSDSTNLQASDALKKEATNDQPSNDDNAESVVNPHNPDPMVADNSSEANERILFTEPISKLAKNELLMGITAPAEIAVSTIILDQKKLMADLGLQEASQKALPTVTITYKPGNKTEEKGLKKILNYARNVKNGEESLPSLRKMKEDLLALNLSKKKNKEENNK